MRWGGKNLIANINIFPRQVWKNSGVLDMLFRFIR